MQVQLSTEELAAEVWKEVANFPDYECSDMGRVRRTTDGLRTYAGRVLCIGLDGWGYPLVSLYLNRKRATPKVHNLVMTSFVGPKPDGIVVNHRSGVKMDNRLKNLEYVTPSENALHAYRTGLSPMGDRHGSRLHPESRPRGESCWSASLTSDDVSGIRRMHSTGVSMVELAVQFRVGQPAIWKIIHRRTWKHVP